MSFQPYQSGLWTNAVGWLKRPRARSFSSARLRGLQQVSPPSTRLETTGRRTPNVLTESHPPCTTLARITDQSMRRHRATKEGSPGETGRVPGVPESSGEGNELEL